MSDGYINLPITGGGGGVTSVTASSPLASSGGSTPNISLQHGDYADTDLGNLTSPTAVNQILLPAADATLDFGSSTQRYKSGFFSDYIAAGGPGAQAAAFPGFSGFGQGTTYTMQVGSNTYGGFGDFGVVGFLNRITPANAIGLFAGSLGGFTQAVDDLSIAYSTNSGANYFGVATFSNNGDTSLYRNLLFNGNGTIGVSGGGANPSGGYFTEFLQVSTNKLWSGPKGITGSLILGDGGTLAAGNAITLFGVGAGAALTSGGSNVAVGMNALGKETTGYANTAVGTGALSNQVGMSGITAVGYNAGGGSNSSNSCYFGQGAGNLDQGTGNVFVGSTAGGQNAAGVQSVFVGEGAGLSNTNSDNNTYIGWRAGYFATGANNILLGCYAQLSSPGASNEMQIASGPVPVNNIYINDSGSGVNIHNLQVRFSGSIGVGNSAAATTPGTVVQKIEIFDASGSSLGFIPVYDSIT